jgi:Ankyrin repeats (3 copies)
MRRASPAIRLPKGWIVLLPKILERALAIIVVQSVRHRMRVKSLSMVVRVCSGASVTCSDRDGLTALSWSSVQGQLHCTQLLLERGSDIDHADKNQRTPLYLASSSGHEQVVRSRLIETMLLWLCQHCPEVCAFCEF